MSQQERFTQALERLDAVVAQAEDRIVAAAPGERPREEARLGDALSQLDALLPAEARDQELTAPPSEAGIYAAQNAAVAMAHVARVGEGRIRGAVEGSGIRRVQNPGPRFWAWRLLSLRAMRPTARRHLAASTHSTDAGNRLAA